MAQVSSYKTSKGCGRVGDPGEAACAVFERRHQTLRGHLQFSQRRCVRRQTDSLNSGLSSDVFLKHSVFHDPIGFAEGKAGPTPILPSTAVLGAELSVARLTIVYCRRTSRNSLMASPRSSLVLRWTNQNCLKTLKGLQNRLCW